MLNCLLLGKKKKNTKKHTLKYISTRAFLGTNKRKWGTFKNWPAMIP